MEYKRLIKKLEYTQPTEMYPYTKSSDPDFAYDISNRRGIRGKFGDTYPMTWGADGEIYTSAGDPCWGKVYDGLDVEKLEI